MCKNIQNKEYNFKNFNLETVGSSGEFFSHGMFYSIGSLVFTFCPDSPVIGYDAVSWDTLAFSNFIKKISTNESVDFNILIRTGHSGKLREKSAISLVDGKIQMPYYDIDECIKFMTFESVDIIADLIKLNKVILQYRTTLLKT